MSSQQYQVPATQQNYGAGETRDFANTVVTATMFYTCGDCAARVPLEKNTPIRCQKCGARV